jgi:uncharacterized protein (TIGR02996 family)
MSAAPTRPYSPEELLALPNAGRYELSAGRLVERTGGEDVGRVGSRLLQALAKFLKSASLGRAFSAAEAAYDLFANGTTIRRPAVSFVQSDRLPDEETHLRHLAPDLAAEVVSPDDRYEVVVGKVEEYLRAGARLVWVISPNNRLAWAHRADGASALVRDGTLDGEEVLPGFSVSLRSLLPRPSAKVAKPAPTIVSGKDQRALVEAIRANLDDDLPRLAFADLCEENGDQEYAEFVRTQCSLARLPWDDPQGPALRRRERELLPAANERYQRALGRGRVQQFERGFPAVRLAAATLVELGARQHEAGPVLHVQIANARSGAHELAASGALANVPSISLQGNAMTGQTLKAILGSPALRDVAALDLSGVNLGTPAVKELVATRWPRLRRLVLSHCRLYRRALETLARAPWLGQLEVLNVGANHIIARELNESLAAADLGRVVDLDLSRLVLRDADAFASFLAHPRLGALRRLALCDASMEDESVAVLADAPRLSELRELGLNDIWIGAAGIRPLVSSPHFNRLEGLNLSSSLRDDAALRALSTGRGLPALTTLRLGGCDMHFERVSGYQPDSRVSLGAFREFLRSERAGRLRRLALNHNYLGPTGMEALASSPRLGGLVELDLTGCYLSLPALRHLAKGTGLSGLRYLRLIGNDIDDESARAILASAALANLRELTLPNPTKLSEGVLGALRERLGPGLVV